MRSLDVKIEVIIDHFRFEIARKHVTMLFLGTLQKSISSRNSLYSKSITHSLITLGLSLSVDFAMVVPRYGILYPLTIVYKTLQGSYSFSPTNRLVPVFCMKNQNIFKIIYLQQMNVYFPPMIGMARYRLLINDLANLLIIF